MDEQAMPVLVHQGKPSKPCQVLGRQIAGIIGAVAFEGPLAAIPPPAHQIAIRAMPARSADQHLLMIAAQADETSLLIRLPADQEVDDPTTVGTSVDVVTDKDEPRVLVRARQFAHGEQREQFVKTAVNIADGKGQ
jgi:hypothetical protein